MTVQFNPQINTLSGPGSASVTRRPQEGGSSAQGDFAKAIRQSLGSVNQDQHEANASIVDLLSGKQQDVNAVVADVAKADMSFKMLVGVRNKLVEAYKETMRMQI
ncbi:MAG: flagellar hook-basal body complex protein FliE [Planctomycetes bacterium]|jgi:flagellar hook-basal body complex protein FliE|nr:flagellar hook-basal body complex protein FliE [Planctomycetota bacterium]